ANLPNNGKQAQQQQHAANGLPANQQQQQAPASGPQFGGNGQPPTIINGQPLSGQVSISPISAGSGKESVFVRMSNKIISLELNLSLSSQYLEELSQKYRRQMDEMQKNFNQTVVRLNENAKRAAEKDNRQQQLLDKLEARILQLENGVWLLLLFV